jgi:pyrrolysine biosynthesis protein PylD
MTRLTEQDVRRLGERLGEFEKGLRRVTGCGLLAVAEQAADAGPGAAARLAGARLAVVPVSAGQGFIPGFTECVATILAHLGCDAFVTPEPDVRGLQIAAARGAEAVLAADDQRFIALNIRSGACVDDDPATAAGFVAALGAAAGGLAGRPVLVLGLGPVGLAAVARLRRLDAEVLAVERDQARAAEAAAAGLEFRSVALDEGLATCRLVLDATPSADLVDAPWVTGESIVAVPGLPSAFTAAAQAALGDRHIHEPLALGVAVMAVQVLA